ncbi:hypothetical protein QFZ54_002255 [Sphingomonas faeni]|nr:hypothetical protein [Sphingomonas faeni]
MFRFSGYRFAHTRLRDRSGMRGMAPTPYLLAKRPRAPRGCSPDAVSPLLSYMDRA